MTTKGGKMILLRIGVPIVLLVLGIYVARRVSERATKIYVVGFHTVLAILAAIFIPS